MIRSKLSSSSPSMWPKSPGDPLLGEVEDYLLGPVDQVVRLAGPVPRAARSRAPARRARAASPSRARSARSGQRSLSRGRARRSRGSGRGRRPARARPLLQLRDGDRVDRLALLEEPSAARKMTRGVRGRSRRLRFSLTAPIALGREQHRAQHRLLGIEVLRGNVGGLCRRGHGGDLGHGTH